MVLDLTRQSGLASVSAKQLNRHAHLDQHPPMKSVTVHKAKTTLSKLIAEVEAGEEILIMRGSEPAARLVPVESTAHKRQFGALAGQVSVTPAFFEPLPEDELASWEN